jgi:SAM-dependent methyltransferase
MSEDRATTLFFELFDGLPRQGPGDDGSTLRALALVPGAGPRTRVLDLGCGTGRQTLVLARATGASIVAVDSHPPFVEELNRQARTLGLAGRVEGRVADMRQLDLAAGSFDLVWSEGAIYVMGFEAGLRAWRPLLAPGGHVAVTEACWLRPDPPPECAAFWQEEYPAMRDVADRLAVVGSCGYETVGHFTLPASSWWDDYYRHLEANALAFRRRHAGEEDARALADQASREIEVWRRFSDWYGYEFFVMRPA